MIEEDGEGNYVFAMPYAYTVISAEFEKIPMPADMTELAEAVADADKVDLDKYTKESADAFRAVLAKAREMLEDTTLTEDDQADVDAMVKALRDAKAALFSKEDTENPGGEDSKNPGGEDTENSEKPGAADKNKMGQGTPRTGETNFVVWMFMAMMFSIIGAALLRRKIRKDDGLR